MDAKIKNVKSEVSIPVVELKMNIGLRINKIRIKYFTIGLVTNSLITRYR